MNVTWLMPTQNDSQNVSAIIEKVYIGKNDVETYNDKKYLYRINTPIISENIYREIINSFINNNNSKNNDNYNYKYLKFNKQMGSIKKIEKKKLLQFSLTICPVCQHSNCIQCITFKKQKNIPDCIKCYNCANTFQTKGRYNNLIKCKKYQCEKCQIKYKLMYDEFLIYNNNKITSPLQRILNIHFGEIKLNNNKRKKLKYIYDHYFSNEVKEQLNNDYQTLYYHIKVKMENTNALIIIPPLIFFLDMNKPKSFYLKLINPNNKKDYHLDIKCQYGSVNSRAQGGKNSLYRNTCLTKRYVSSARLVIVPRQALLPHECILPDSVYRNLNCPKHVLCHRYPTLDVRNMTYHTVVGTWQYPTLAISTAIVSGNNADFDGDCIHVIPATNIMSQAELIILCHPQRNMIVQRQLRLKFDHDEIETIYSHFGLTGSEIHDIIYRVVEKQGDKQGYDMFCNIKRYCKWVWEFQGPATITFKDFLQCVDVKCFKYEDYISEIFPKIPYNNGIKKLINSEASRFSIEHLWQIFGFISEDAKELGGFLKGMNKNDFINMAFISRLAMIKDVAFHGYSQIKLNHCTKSVIMAYDKKLYTTDNILTANDIKDLY